MGFGAKKLAAVFRALGDENRVKILGLLSTGEKCACKLLEELEITQPTLSHHMKILCDSGIVSARKEGKWMYYSISGSAGEYLNKCVEDLLSQTETADRRSCCKR